MSEIVSESIEEIEASIPLEDFSADLVAATDHVDLVTQGTIDTIDGLEGYSLTHAQHYLNSVLYASGEVPASVAGNEGVLSTIKGWATKAIEAIKRAFKAIWDYLFGKKDVEQEVKLLKNEIKETVEKVNAFKRKAKAKPEGSSSNVVIELASNYTRAAAETKESDPALSKEYAEAAEKLKENPVITSMSDSRIVMDEKLYKKIKAIAAAADAHVKQCGLDFLDLRLTIHDKQNLSELVTDPKAQASIASSVSNIKTPDDATKALADLDIHITGYGIANTMNALKRNRVRIDGKIKKFESEIDTADAQEQKALRNDISDMKLIGRLIKTVLGRMEAQINAAKRLVKMIPKLHRLPA